MGELLDLRWTKKPPAVSTLFAAGPAINDLIPGGEELDATVFFEEDVWRLGGHRTWRDKAGAETKIDFSRIGEQWRDAAKEMALLQLNPALAVDRSADTPMAQNWADIQEPVVPLTVQANIKMLGHALSIIDAQGIKAFDTDDWARLVVLLVQPQDVNEKRAGATLSSATGRGRAQQLIALWQVTQISSRENLLGSEPPFDGKDSVTLFGRRKKRNSVRPHEAVGNVLGFVSWVFDNIAEDIVSHIEWWASYTTAEPPLNRQSGFESMLDLTARIAHENGGMLPGAPNINNEMTLTHSALGRLIGIYDADEAYLAGRWAMTQLGNSVSLSATVNPCPLPISMLPALSGGTITWADRLMPSTRSLDIWQRRLVYCAMYYLASTVMLRESQLAVLPFDPLTTEVITRPNGATYVKHTLATFKTKNRRAASPTTVTVNGRVARIINLMQRLQQALGYELRPSNTTGVPILFDQRLATPAGKHEQSRARAGLYLDNSFLKFMVAGAEELHVRGVTSHALRDVKLSMRQVRITCAQAYAIREHGQALAAAFGQWDTAAVTAGYIGDVYRLITPVDPTETMDIAKEDIGRRVIQAAADRGSLTGHGLARLDACLDANRTGLSNPKPLTPARAKAIGKKNPNIEQGPLTLCIFQLEGALCGGRGKPDFRLCLPGQCRNSVMSVADRARYELLRRQHLALNSAVLRRAADKMNELNPDIAEEFADIADMELQAIVADHVYAYIKAALEDGE